MNKKLVYNNIPYNVITNIKIGTSDFIICIDEFDNIMLYFMEKDNKEVVPSNELLNTVLDYQKKSMINKMKLLDYFLNMLSKELEKNIFVNYKSVYSLVKKFEVYVSESELNYYLIDNATIDLPDTSLEQMQTYFAPMIDVKQDLTNILELRNELYYYHADEQSMEQKKQDLAQENFSSVIEDDNK